MSESQFYSFDDFDVSDEKLSCFPWHIAREASDTDSDDSTRSSYTTPFIKFCESGYKTPKKYPWNRHGNGEINQAYASTTPFFNDKSNSDYLETLGGERSYMLELGTMQSVNFLHGFKLIFSNKTS